MVERFTDKVEIQDNESNTKILLDGTLGSLSIGTTNPRATLEVVPAQDFDAWLT